MNTILVFSAVCIGLASAGAHHAYHSGGNVGGYSSSAGQQLVDVPYTVEIRSVGSGSGNSYGGRSSSVGRSYQQQQPQIQRSQPVQSYSYSQPQQRHIQRSQPVQSYSYSQPQQRQIQRSQPVQSYSYSQQRQSQQLVDVPYTVETRTVSRGSGGNYGGRSYQQQPQIQRSQPVQSYSYSQPQQQRSIQYQSAPVVQTVGVSQAVSLVPVSVSTPVVLDATSGISGLSPASIETLGGGSIVSPSYIIY